MQEDNERKVVELSIDDILPNRFQPRIKFDDSAIFELSESIKAHGVFQPIIVRPIGDKYEIIAGERRYKASVLANKQTIPAIVMDLDDNDTVEIALIENVQRANLTPIEEAISYKKILDMGYMNQEQLATKLGKTQSTIANKLRLLNLDEDVQDSLLENKISERHARSLLRLKDYAQQRIMLKRIVNERLTVRKTDEEIEKMFNVNQDNNQLNNGPVMINEQSTQNNGGIPEIVEESNDEQSGGVFGFGNTTTNNVQENNFSDVNNRVINHIDYNGADSTTSFNTSTVMNSSQPVENVVTVSAPTMMDIDKIASTATDFNVEKTLAPMDKIMQNDDEFEVTEPEPETNVTSGKFFTFTNNEEEDTKPDYDQQKNFNFDNLYQNVTPVARQDQNYETPDLDFGETTISNKASNSSVSNNGNMGTFFEIPSVNNMQQNEVTSNQSVSATTLSFEEPMPFGFNNVTPTQSASVTPVVKPTMEDAISSSTNFGSIPQYQNLNTVQPEVNVGKNVMDAVNVVRKALDQLKSMGYSVDTDEIDLENMYQLIVKIDK